MPKPTTSEVSTPSQGFNRRNLLHTGVAATAMFAVSPSLSSQVKAQTMSQAWDKVFPQSSSVEHQKVKFKNRYGLTLVGDLYLPKNRSARKLAAIAVSGPFGAVKEQSSGLYAQTMAERGFATLAFDPSYTGESSGEPRNVALHASALPHPCSIHLKMNE